MKKYLPLLLCLGIAAAYVLLQRFLPAVLGDSIAKPIQIGLTIVLVALIAASLLNIAFALALRSSGKTLQATYLFRLGLAWVPLNDTRFEEEVASLKGLHPSGKPIRAWSSEGSPLVRIDFAGGAGDFTVISHLQPGPVFRWIAGIFVLSWKQHPAPHEEVGGLRFFYHGHHQLQRLSAEQLEAEGLAQTVRDNTRSSATGWQCRGCGAVRIDWLADGRVIHSVSRGLELDPTARAYGPLLMYSGPSSDADTSQPKAAA